MSALKNFLLRKKERSYATEIEGGASYTVEVVVVLLIVIVIAAAMFIFRDIIVQWINDAGNTVKNWTMTT